MYNVWVFVLIINCSKAFLTKKLIITKLTNYIQINWLLIQLVTKSTSSITDDEW